MVENLQCGLFATVLDTHEPCFQPARPAFQIPGSFLALLREPQHPEPGPPPGCRNLRGQMEKSILWKAVSWRALTPGETAENTEGVPDVFGGCAAFSISLRGRHFCSTGKTEVLQKGLGACKSRWQADSNSLSW